MSTVADQQLITSVQKQCPGNKMNGIWTVIDKNSKVL